MKRWRFNRLSLGRKIQLLMISVALPLILLVVLLMSLLVHYSNQYNQVFSNLTVASEFNYDFKKELDYKVYQYIVNRKEVDVVGALEDVERARNVINRLQQNTFQAGGEQRPGEMQLLRLQEIQRFLKSLEKGITDIRGGAGYEKSINRLDTNIYVLTELIQDRMQEYTYYEAQNLAAIRDQVYAAILRVVLAIGVISAMVVALVFFMAFRVANSMTKPLKVLRENIQKVGRGDFTVRQLETQNDEIQSLSSTFDSMVEQIGVLMDNVREEQDNLRETELKLLQAQINPHFLYNTFDTIVWLAEDKQNEQVIQMVDSLSTFFRASLSDGEDIITIQEEARHIRSYLEIQQVRYRDILSYEIDIAPEIQKYMIPKLTLQPLVENALYHGVKNKRGPGKIVVRGGLVGGRIRFTVWDNGKGMGPRELANLQDSIRRGTKVSFGMTNVNERIQLYYGKEYGLTVESRADAFTEVTVMLSTKKIQSRT